MRGQTQLFAHPAVLTDPRRCRLYNYRAAPGWDGPCDGAGTRAALLADLERALALALGCPEALRRAGGGAGPKLACRPRRAANTPLQALLASSSAALEAQTLGP